MRHGVGKDSKISVLSLNSYKNIHINIFEKIYKRKKKLYEYKWSPLNRVKQLRGEFIHIFYFVSSKREKKTKTAQSTFIRFICFWQFLFCFFYFYF